ncbi:MAG: polysaccharide deacetylase family protein, partial [Deltaproteobacteria bacterium]|nr:polysaccharide deacetylase family protein [Deltaproteobacteria bacterium]
MVIRYYTHGTRKENKVALTFDDGPNPPRTDQVMDILESKGVRGTFF